MFDEILHSTNMWLALPVASRSRRTAVLALGLTLLAAGVFAGDTVRTKTLFQIARSKNKNVVHYGVVLRDGKLDLNEPFIAYWVMHAEDGRREGLTFLEEQLAYGFTLLSKPSSSGFRVRLKAFPKRSIDVVARGDRGYRAELVIAGREATLERIFVATDESGITPSVRYVDLLGTVVGGERKVTERLVP